MFRIYDPSSYLCSRKAKWIDKTEAVEALDLGGCYMLETTGYLSSRKWWARWWHREMEGGVHRSFRTHNWGSPDSCFRPSTPFCLSSHFLWWWLWICFQPTAIAHFIQSRYSKALSLAASCFASLIPLAIYTLHPPISLRFLTFHKGE